MKHLRYDIQRADMSGKAEHPQIVMKGLGITYQHGTPQSIADQWWFWNCKNIPDPLPEYLSVLEVDPMRCIGLGLSQEEAESIRDYDDKKTER
jgi:hypothetical protein